MESNWKREESYTMFIQPEGRKLWPLVKDRTLKPMDLCVADYLCTYMDIRTGRVEKRTKDIADDLGLTPSYLTMSMKRLRQQLLLAKGLKGTGYYWMLNPYYWSVGRADLHGKRMTAFAELVA